MERTWAQLTGVSEVFNPGRRQKKEMRVRWKSCQFIFMQLRADDDELSHVCFIVYCVSLFRVQHIQKVPGQSRTRVYQKPSESADTHTHKTTHKTTHKQHTFTNTHTQKTHSKQTHTLSAWSCNSSSFRIKASPSDFVCVVWLRGGK